MNRTGITKGASRYAGGSGTERTTQEVIEPTPVDGATSPPAPGYLSYLECDVMPTPGLAVHIRPIRADDAAPLVAFHEELTPRSVYRRFFSVHPTLSPAEVERFTCVDYVDRLALVAYVADRLVAVVRYDRSPGGAEAEVALVVADALQHHGIATLMLKMLASAAWRSGITAFVASTLAENREMLSVFRHSGFQVSTHLSGGIVEVRFSIDPTTEREYTERSSAPVGSEPRSKGPLPC
jgi:GNAT superfamily N-acetyltransferase